MYVLSMTCPVASHYISIYHQYHHFYLSLTLSYSLYVYILFVRC